MTAEMEADETQLGSVFDNASGVRGSLVSSLSTGSTGSGDADSNLRAALRKHIEIILRKQDEELTLRLANMEQSIVECIKQDPLHRHDAEEVIFCPTNATSGCNSTSLISMEGILTPGSRPPGQYGRLSVTSVKSKASVSVALRDRTIMEATQTATSSKTLDGVDPRKLSRAGSAGNLATVDQYSSLRHRIYDLVIDRKFEMVSALAIASNAVFIGLLLQFVEPSSQESNHWGIKAVQLIYLAFFCGELLLRMVAHGTKFFWCQDWAWNYFDLVIVLSTVIDEAMVLIVRAGASGLSIMRMVRILRVLRILRVFRVLRFLRNLRVLIVSIMSAVKSLTWALVLLGLNIYGFSCVFTQAVRGHDLYEHAHFAGLRQDFGTIARTTYTLFLAISGGVSWTLVMKDMFEVGWIYVLLFIFYIAFTQLAMLNVITGVFCQNAIESAARDDEEIVLELMKQKDEFVEKLRRIFVGIGDRDKDSLTFAQFEAHLEDEKAQAAFKVLGLDVSDAETLFGLLDSDGKGCVDIMDFVTGCLQLRGAAKSIDIAKLQHDNQTIIRANQAIRSQLQQLVARERASTRQASFDAGSGPQLSGVRFEDSEDTEFVKKRASQCSSI